MSKARTLSLLMTMIGLLMIEVNAKPTVDNNPSFESTNLYETVNQMQEQLPELRNLLESPQQTLGAIKLCEYETLYSHTVFVNTQWHRAVLPATARHLVSYRIV